MGKDTKRMQGVRGIVVGMAAALTVTGAVPVFAENGSPDGEEAGSSSANYNSQSSSDKKEPEQSSEASSESSQTPESSESGEGTSPEESKEESGESQTSASESGGKETTGSSSEIAPVDPSEKETTKVSPTETLPAETTVPAVTTPAESSPAESSSSETESSSEETLPEETIPVKIFTPGEGVDLAKAEAELPVNLSPIRKKIAMEAYSLVGQVGYFWGGKSLAYNWDGRWGDVQMVTIEGSKSTGTLRSFGLDCSGFVAWVYVNAFGSTGIFDEVGETTASQWAKSYEIGWDQVLPGDLVFKKQPSDGGTNHVGVVVKAENGEIWVAHCASSKNNVVVTDASRFAYARRPYLLQNECACTRMTGKIVIHEASCKEYTGLNTNPDAADPKVWGSVEQLTVDLQSLFPDAAFAGAVADALWEQYAAVPRETAGRIAQEVAAECDDIFELAREIETRMAAEPKQLNLGESGAETLPEFVMEAELSVKANGQVYQEERRQAEETGAPLSPEAEAWVPIRDIEGIQYLKSAREIDLAYNEITSLTALDYSRTDAEGKQIYAYSGYVQNPLTGLWIEAPEGKEQPDGILRLYFGGGLPGSLNTYETVLRLAGNEITEAPEEYPGRLVFDGFPAEPESSGPETTGADTEQ